MTAHTIEAELTWTGRAFEKAIRVAVDDRGRIASVGPAAGRADLVLDGQALLPGMVNAHSHAFQRGLRGLGETFPAESGTFWSWREAMYALVERLDETTFRELCVRAFREMLSGGITTVGEFHYLHHADAGGGYAFDRVVLEAALEAGIRIVLLNAYYRTGGIDRPLSPVQQRFGTASLEEYWLQHEALEKALEPRTQSLGVVAHSIRAASIAEIEELHAESLRRGLVFHMHLEEQQQEIDDSVQAYGASPLELVHDRLTLGPHFTAVHCTRSVPETLRKFLSTGANICLTPLTEANLGDGIPDENVFAAGMSQISLGSDSNFRISMFEEMRWLEFGQRLARHKRGVLRNGDGEVAPSLFTASTEGGARSLGIDAGRIAPGSCADFFTADLASLSLEGWTADSLLTSIVFGASEEIVNRVCVAGRWISLR